MNYTIEHIKEVTFHLGSHLKLRIHWADCKDTGHKPTPLTPETRRHLITKTNFSIDMRKN